MSSRSVHRTQIVGVQHNLPPFRATLMIYLDHARTETIATRKMAGLVDIVIPEQMVPDSVPPFTHGCCFKPRSSLGNLEIVRCGCWFKYLVSNRPPDLYQALADSAQWPWFIWIK